MEFKRAHCPCLQLAAKLALESVRKEVESSRNARVAQGVHVPDQQQVSRGKGRGRRKAEQVSSKRVNDANLKIEKHVREGAGESINLKCRTRNNRELVRAFSLFNLGHNLLTSPRWRLNQFFFFTIQTSDSGETRAKEAQHKEARKGNGWNSSNGHKVQR